MNYTTSDAIALWKRIQSDLLAHGPDYAFTSAKSQDEELLALTLTLAIQTTYPLPPN